MKINGDNEDESKANDCSAHPRVLTIGANRSVGADCKGENRKAISEEEDCPSSPWYRLANEKGAERDGQRASERFDSTDETGELSPTGAGGGKRSAGLRNRRKETRRDTEPICVSTERRRIAIGLLHSSEPRNPRSRMR
jgi:hypothetical protein